jgi:repressor LexA
MVIRPYNETAQNKGQYMEPLTEKQQKVLRYIEGRLQKDNPPSQREIAGHFGLAQNAVYQLVSYLKKKGYLTDCGGHRGLRLSKAYLDKARQTEGLPIVGTVAAGTPILAEENIEGHIDIKELFGRANDEFVLKVKGDSMVDAGIMDGDLVVVRAGSDIANGQIGVAAVNDEVTVKRIYIRRDRITLEPANKTGAYKTIEVKKNSGTVRMIGKVTGCIRRFS